MWLSQNLIFPGIHQLMNTTNYLTRKPSTITNHKNYKIYPNSWTRHILKKNYTTNIVLQTRTKRMISTRKTSIVSQFNNMLRMCRNESRVMWPLPISSMFWKTVRLSEDGGMLRWVEVESVDAELAKDCPESVLDSGGLLEGDKSYLTLRRTKDTFRCLAVKLNTN